jgi:NADH-quinone oxidoreductase subunit M
MILSLIFLILIITISLLSFINNKNINYLRATSLIGSGAVFILSLFLFINFDAKSEFFQHFVTYSVGSSLLNMSYSFGLDSISIFFFILSTLLIFVCNLFIWYEKLIKEYVLTLLLIEFFLLIIFSVLDLFLFYVFFEAILIPMYIVIGFWGSRARKIRAVYLFFFYTLCSSILLLLGILYIYSITGTLNLEYILAYTFSSEDQHILWLCFFISFASKIPMFPFHIWLPEAHVEAPTVGSVLLAGILLKLGVYGFLRFSLTLFPLASIYFAPLVYILSLVGVLYASLTAIRQTDLKRIIAYSSIAHMNLVTLGIFSFNILSIEGVIFQSVSHGFVSGGMFLLIGVLYDRYHSRSLYYYSGLVHIMPIYAVFFLIFTLANIALPGTSSFIGEFILLLGIYKINSLTGIICALSVVLCGSYSLWLYNKIIFGNIKQDFALKYKDLNVKEFIVILPLFLLIFFLGVNPDSFFIIIHDAVVRLVSGV